MSTKKIMSRTEAYAAIKSMGLQDACVKKFGKNFTMCKTADLIALIESNNKVASKPAPAAPANDGQCVDVVARIAISKLIDILEDNGTIEDYEKEEVLNILGGTVSVSSVSSEELKPRYSDDEIDDMFTGMGVN